MSHTTPIRWAIRHVNMPPGNVESYVDAFAPDPNLPFAERWALRRTTATARLNGTDDIVVPVLVNAGGFVELDTGDVDGILATSGTVADLRKQLEQANAEHRADIATISRAFDTEARARDWCHEYEDFRDDVNQRLHVKMDDVPHTDHYQVSLLIELRTEGRLNFSTYDVEEQVRAALNERAEQMKEDFSAIASVRAHDIAVAKINPQEDDE